MKNILSYSVNSISRREKSISSLHSTLALVFLFTITFGGLVICIGFNNIVIRIGLFATVAIIVVLMAGGDLMHPYTWFIPVFSLYSLSAPVATMVGLYPNLEPYVAHALLLEYVALVSFIMGSLPTNLTGRRKPKLELTTISKSFYHLRYGMWPLMVVSWILSGVSVVYAATTNFNSKMEFALRSSILGKLQFAFSLLLLSIIAILTISVYKKRVPKLFWLIAATWFGIATVVLQERNLLFQFIIVSIFIYHLFIQKIRLRKLIVIGLICFFLIGLLGMYRAIKHYGSSILSSETMLSYTFLGEFQSASYNLMVLLDGLKSGIVEYKCGKTFIADIIQQFTSSSLFTEREERQNGSAWFNKTFYPSTFAAGGGRGFSLVAEGYLNFGIIGVIGLFFLLSTMLNILYKRSNVPFIALIYVLIIPSVLYSIRMDLATLLSYAWKHVTIPILLIIVVSKFIVESVHHEPSSELIGGKIPEKMKLLRRKSDIHQN